MSTADNTTTTAKKITIAEPNVSPIVHEVESTPVSVNLSRPRPVVPIRRFDLARRDLAELLESEPAYRVNQVWAGLYEQGLDIDEMTSLPKALRARLNAEDSMGTSLLKEVESSSEAGETIKWLWGLQDASRIETVLMHYRDRSTVCISSQAGCRMATTS